MISQVETSQVANEKSSTGFSSWRLRTPMVRRATISESELRRLMPASTPISVAMGMVKEKQVGQQVEQDLEDGPGRRPLGDERLGEDEDLVDQQGEGVDQQPDGERRGDLLQDVAVEDPFHPEIIA